jgi:hypothetical protein
MYYSRSKTGSARFANNIMTAYRQNQTRHCTLIIVIRPGKCAGFYAQNATRQSDFLMMTMPCSKKQSDIYSVKLFTDDNQPE